MSETDIQENNIGGRPTKMTPERRTAIVDAINSRIPYKLAAEANGITERLFYYWLARGEADTELGVDTEFSAFFQSIKSTELKKIKEHMDCINFNPERWQAQAWILERRWSDYFGNNAQLVAFQQQLDRMEKQLEGARNVEANSGKA